MRKIESFRHYSDLNFEAMRPLDNSDFFPTPPPSLLCKPVFFFNFAILVDPDTLPGESPLGISGKIIKKFDKRFHCRFQEVIGGLLSLRLCL